MDMATTFLIGERLNSSRPSVKRIFEERDEGALVAAAEEQIAGGASCIDLNASMLMDGEADALRWGARTVREKLGVRVMLDSPNTRILLDLAPEFGSEAILNSLTCDGDGLAEALAVASRTGSGVVIMLKERAGIPETVAGRLALADRATGAASGAGCAPERVFIDPVFTPLATSRRGLLTVLETMRDLKNRYGAYRRIGGLSNVSFGLPERKLLNRSFAAMLIGSGADALICDTTDRDLMRMIKASEALAGLDANCRAFLEFYRGERRTP
jgi:5-methyltetrahydrofolate--homocysteine methyltransferase